MKRSLSSAFAIGSALAMSACAINLDAAQPAPITDVADVSQPALFDTDNVLILLDSEQEASELIINVSRGGYQLRDRHYLAGMNLILLDFQRPPGISDEIAVNDMQRMNQSAIVGLDNFYMADARDTTTAQPSGRIYANRLMQWPDTGCRAQTSIGVIDGVLKPSAATFPGATIISEDFTRNGGANAQHAESVASMLVGPGRLTDAKIFSAAVIGETKQGFSGSGTKELILALNWMQTNNVPVVNISLSGPRNPLLDIAVSRLAEQGMIIVAAVGNEGPNSPPRYPAAHVDVIAVTAIDAAKQVFTDAVRGPHVDYAAPGVDIFIEAGVQLGQYVSGTSFAAPAVTALIAADTTRSYEHSTEVVRDYLNQQATDLGVSGHDPIFGHGLVRAPGMCAALYSVHAEGDAA